MHYSFLMQASLFGLLIFLSYAFYRSTQQNSSILSGANFKKASETMLWLALCLIIFVAFLISLLPKSAL